MPRPKKDAAKKTAAKAKKTAAQKKREAAAKKKEMEAKLHAAYEKGYHDAMKHVDKHLTQCQKAIGKSMPKKGKSKAGAKKKSTSSKRGRPPKS